MKAEPAQAYCKQCGELFVYFRTGRAARFNCSPCIEKDRQGHNEFLRRQRRAKAAATGRVKGFWRKGLSLGEVHA